MCYDCLLLCHPVKTLVGHASFSFIDRDDHHEIKVIESRSFRRIFAMPRGRRLKSQAPTGNKPRGKTENSSVEKLKKLTGYIVKEEFEKREEDDPFSDAEDDEFDLSGNAIKRFALHKSKGEH